jgi:hypothetical protein
MGTGRTPLTGRICDVLGHEPRTRQEIALAAGYDGHGQVLSEALAQLVTSGHVVRTPAGWQASLRRQPNGEGCPGSALGGNALVRSMPAGDAYEPQPTWAIPPAPVEPLALLTLLKS